MRFTGQRSVLLLFWFVLACACSPSTTATPVPTQTLIPPTITDTPTPVTPTAIPPSLPAPDDVFSLTPTAGMVLIPAIAQPLVAEIIGDLAQNLEIDADAVQLLRFEAATWTTIDFGCGEERLSGVDNIQVEGYRVVLSAQGETYEYHTDSGSAFRQCGQQGVFAGETDPQAFLQVDPVAAELVILAQRRLGQELDLPSSRIRLVDISPVTWTDSSLGCPADGQTYRAVEIDGYRIVMAVANREYIFHTDSERLTPCTADAEVLP
jgi:hypothetical protein